MNYYQENLDFAQQVKDKVGLPVWDYTIYNTYDVDKLAFIPCARENSNYTEGVIIILHDNATGKLLFNYTDRYNFDAYLNPLVEVGYDNVPDRTYIMSLFLLFDKKLFNYIDCDILADLGYLLGSMNQTGTKAGSFEEECRMEYVETEIDHWVDTYVGGELISHKYSHSSREYNFEWICREVAGEREKLPWGNQEGGGGNPPEDPTKWSPKNAEPKKLKDCDELNSIDKKSWFNLSNGDRIAHLMDAMRYENKVWQNGGHIDLNNIFDFGSMGSDNYAAEFAGRVIINGITIDMTVSMSVMGYDNIYTEGEYVHLPDKFNANTNGYSKTGYWAGYEYFVKNSLTGGSCAVLLSIKLGENSNLDETNLNLFKNALKECND
ncbi:hypothetical protein [Marinifilum flexuosum]|nr:hypothetical protein [Marinifilum flexuosum]